MSAPEIVKLGGGAQSADVMATESMRDEIYQLSLMSSPELIKRRDEMKRKANDLLRSGFESNPPYELLQERMADPLSTIGLIDAVLAQRAGIVAYFRAKQEEA